MSSASSMERAAQPTRGRNWLWLVTVLFCILALLISGYLSWTTLTGTETVCIEGEFLDCSKVESSIYSKLLGVPVAYLGLITYVIILALLLLEKRNALVREYGVLVVFGLSLFGFLFHSYLTYISITRLDAICPWCVLTNFSMLIILIATLTRVVKRFVLTGP